MARLGNVLIASSGHAVRPPLADSLSRLDLSVDVCASTEALRKAAQYDHPDLILIDMDSQDTDGFGLAGVLGKGPVPVVLCAQHMAPADFVRALEGGVQDVLAGPMDEDALEARLRPLLRLSTQRREIFRRLSILSQFEGPKEPLPLLNIKKEPLAILFIGRYEADRAHVTDALGPHGGVVASADLFAAGNWLTEAPFDGAILYLSDGDERGDYLSFCKQIRQNPNLYNMPLILVDPAGPAGDPYGHGISLALAGRPDADVLRFFLVTFCSRQRLRSAIRDAADKSKQPLAMDGKTETYSSEFLQGYLGTLIAAAEARQKYLSLFSLCFPSVGGVRHHLGTEAAEHLLWQIAGWIKLLIRTEDLVARCGDNGFCITLPGAPLEEARLVMRRIAGILGHTDFAVRDVYQAIAVEVDVGLAALQPGDTPDSLLARALAS